MRTNWRFALVVSLAAVGAVAASAKAGDDTAPPAKTAPAAGDSDREKWAEHMGDLPFVIGYEKGMKEVEFTGRPPMYFFTATW
jgi:cytochrome oxidase Cu insertion factor (SCO1/SenC/PrrC family)